VPLGFQYTVSVSNFLFMRTRCQSYIKLGNYAPTSRRTLTKLKEGGCLWVYIVGLSSETLAEVNVNQRFLPIRRDIVYSLPLGSLMPPTTIQIMNPRHHIPIAQ